MPRLLPFCLGTISKHDADLASRIEEALFVARRSEPCPPHTAVAIFAGLSASVRAARYALWLARGIKGEISPVEHNLNNLQVNLAHWASEEADHTPAPVLADAARQRLLAASASYYRMREQCRSAGKIRRSLRLSRKSHRRWLRAIDATILEALRQCHTDAAAVFVE